MAFVRDGLFGSAGQLPPQALARFVVLAGAAPDAVQQRLSDPAAAPDPMPPSALERSPDEATWLCVDLDRAAALGERLSSGPDATAFAVWLDENWTSAVGATPVSALVTHGPDTLDTAWLTRLLQQHAPVDAVVFDHAGWRASALDWPLRVAVPPSAGGQILAPLLAVGGFRDLYDPVLARGAQDIDVLLFPGSLAEALRSARRSRHRRASAVIVLGAEGPVPLEALRELAYRWEAALVSACGLEAALWPRLWSELVAQFSHNLPLPTALFEARRRTGPGDDPLAAVVLADLTYARHNRPVDVALRLAHALRQHGDLADVPVPPALGPVNAGDDVALALESGAPHWDWTAETQGASRLVQVRRALEQRLGPITMRHRPPRMEAAMVGMEPPESPPQEPAPRHVKFDLWPVEATAAPREPMPLTPEAVHRLEVFIAEADVAAQGTADQPLDESVLPPSADGHELTIVYCPLSPIDEVDGRPHILQPTMGTLHLPPRGTSTRVAFTLRCGAVVADFRARLIVLHANRALQTLLLTAPEDGLLRLEAENVYAPSFESPSADAPSDLTFVINENPQGRHGLATIGKDAASFIEPAGLDETWKSMTKVLTEAVREEAGRKGLGIDREQTLSLMRALAYWGAAIRKQLVRQHPVAALESAQRVQVVEAVSEAFFPVEFLYAGKPPEPTAALCPNALAALSAGDNRLHDQCPHKNDKHHVCPMAFWGFHKCIERHTSTGSRDHVVSIPQPGDERLGPFKSVLMGASVNASAEMKGPKGLPATVRKMAPHSAYVTSWDAWSKEIQDAHPDLLVLLSHSGASQDIEDAGALEISTDHRTIGLLDDEYVHTGEGKGPLVLLLGCSTSLSDVPFLSSVRQFHESGAPVVIGTLSVIHGSQAHLIVQRLLALAMDPARSGQRLDEALLRVRRDLLAQGHGVAFTLSAYGHSSWHI